jgi:hypothetical protein
MAIAILTLHEWLAPLQALLDWLAPQPAKRPHRDLQQPQRNPRVTALAPMGRRPSPPPLRVVRVFEPSQPRAAAGRMVISGRLADVCAELDRLAAQEAARR